MFWPDRQGQSSVNESSGLRGFRVQKPRLHEKKETMTPVLSDAWRHQHGKAPTLRRQQNDCSIDDVRRDLATCTRVGFAQSNVNRNPLSDLSASIRELTIRASQSVVEVLVNGMELLPTVPGEPPIRFLISIPLALACWLTRPALS